MFRRGFTLFAGIPWSSSPCRPPFGGSSIWADHAAREVGGKNGGLGPLVVLQKST